jgi:hypothetical protein
VPEHSVLQVQELEELEALALAWVPVLQTSLWSD